MEIKQINQTMYPQNVYLPDPYKGCNNGCVYCKPSFQRQAKRQMHRCKKCYTFEPHEHLERLNRKAPKTVGKQFIFFPKGGDLGFAQPDVIHKIIQYIEKNSQATFLIQSKIPEWMQYYKFPDNVILGTTMETNKTDFNTPSCYKYYGEISNAILPLGRAIQFYNVKHSRKAIIIEPILQFDLERIKTWVLMQQPEFVYVGYDTKNCKLPEPTLAETLALIEALEKEGIEVRQKTIRKAWYEQGGKK